MKAKVGLTGYVEAVTSLSVFLLLLSGRCESQFNTNPPCNNDAAALCVEQALQAEGPTGCNWFTVMPALYDCINTAVAGCYYEDQSSWFNLADDVNITYMSNSCYSPCQNQASKMATLQNCFQQNDPSVVITAVQGTPGANSQSSACNSLVTMNNCATSAAAGCPSLMDLAYYTIFSVQGASSAYQTCAVSPPPTATTSAPVALFNTMPATSSTVSSNEVLSTGISILLIVLGAVIIAATIIIIITMCVMMARRRHAAYRKSLLGDWKPNGQTVYRDQPQVLTTTQPVVQNVFRPVRYGNSQGGPVVLNQAAQADYGPVFFTDAGNLE